MHVICHFCGEGFDGQLDQAAEPEATCPTCWDQVQAEMEHLVRSLPAGTIIIGPKGVLFEVQ